MPAPSEASPAEPADARLDRGLALGLGLVTTIALWATEKAVGVPRDESFYFRAASDYAGWFKQLWSGTDAFSDAVIARYFSYNSEHPALMKELFGLSHALFFDSLHWTRSITAYRIPTLVLSGVFTAALYTLGRGMKGRLAGCVAAVGFWLIPRNWFHGHLACFDFPIAAMWFFVVLAYWKAATSRRWGWATGVLFGLALATKHNAFFLPPVLVLHWLMTGGWRALRTGGIAAAGRAVPLSLISMATVGPAVFFLHWPLLWHHPIDRISFWIGFHLQHVNYAWYYLGDLMREPPFPISYPFVITWMTVPLALVAAMTTGFLTRAVQFVVGAVGRGPAVSSDDLLLLINGIASIAIIAGPQVPHFGGVKHWMPSIPFLCIFAGEAVSRASALLGPWLAERLHLRRANLWAGCGLAALMLWPALIGTIRNDGWGESFYNELAEGYPGAAALGTQRQFWSNNVLSVLPWLNQHLPPRSKVFFHEVTYDSYRAYVEDGFLRADIQYANGLGDADVACYQYHQEFRFWEYAIWTQLRTRWPVAGLYLDEVPMIECYQRDHVF